MYENYIENDTALRIPFLSSSFFPSLSLFLLLSLFFPTTQRALLSRIILASEAAPIIHWLRGRCFHRPKSSPCVEGSVDPGAGKLLNRDFMPDQRFFGRGTSLGTSSFLV